MTLYTTPPRSFEQTIAPLNRDIQSLCISVRNIIHTTLPDADEGVYGGKTVANILYSVGGENTVICGFQPAEQHVKVFFHHWQVLKDQGVKVAGTGKHARHIKVTPDDEQLKELPQYIEWVHHAAT